MSRRSSDRHLKLHDEAPETGLASATRQEYQEYSLDMDDVKTPKRLEKPDCSAKLSKRCVEVLVDMSEEISEKEQQPKEIFDQTGWDEAIRSWRECSPLSGLFAPLQRSKKVKPEDPAPHCILCTDLKDPKPPENVPSHAASHAFSEKSEEPSTSNCSSSPEDLNRTPSATTISSSTEEEESLDFSLENVSSQKERVLGNKLLYGSGQVSPDKVLPSQMQSDSLLQKGRNDGKMALSGRVMVLPPVKMSAPSTSTLSNSNPLKRTEDGSARPIIIRERVNGNQEQMVVISHPNSAVGTITSKQGPTHHQHHLLTTLNISRGYQIPISTLAETQPVSTSVLEPNFRAEELIRCALRHKSGHRSRSGIKYKTLKREEPELPKLLGTRVQIAVSNHRLL
ncbi:hypothetical protein C0J50_24116 [Silurus asotus]|uniref:Uncharacterized protein n=1 Tax=Silurus asotus TaxID=30991 RepID=A0AAD5AGF8_SILAS|nr:hypothetical protein C0J50_24116 [Silurus asotus]